jgi:hypothetical protein
MKPAQSAAVKVVQPYPRCLHSLRQVERRLLKWQRRQVGESGAGVDGGVEGIDPLAERPVVPPHGVDAQAHLLPQPPPSCRHYAWRQAGNEKWEMGEKRRFFQAAQ